MEFLDTTFLGNTVRAWLIAAGATLAAYVVFRLALLSIARRIVGAVQNEAYLWDDALRGALEETRSSLLLVFAFFVGSRGLTLPGSVGGVLESVAVIAALLQAGLWLNGGLSEWLQKRAKLATEEDPAAAMSMNVLRIVAKLVIWSIVLLLALENVGVDVTALIAGLGVGGIAVALAAQNILGDLFASLSIVLDKPFVLGDFVVVGDYVGSVEAIGLKTTRFRSLSGEQVVFSNADLLASRIRNYGRMYERRVVLTLGVTYQTPRAQLAEISGIIRAAIESHPEETVRFDRAHLSEYGDFSIDFEAVYYVLQPDYALHMDLKQAILLRVHEVFEERGIEYAYPTQTVFVESSGSNRVPA